MAWRRKELWSWFSCRLTSIENPIVEIRRSHDRLISTMGISILARLNFYIESSPRASATMEFTKFFVNIPYSTPEELKCKYPILIIMQLSTFMRHDKSPIGTDRYEFVICVYVCVFDPYNQYVGGNWEHSRVVTLGCWKVYILSRDALSHILI